MGNIQKIDFGSMENNARIRPKNNLALGSSH